MIPLQPYQAFDVSLIHRLVARQCFYLVSQSYNRAKAEVEAHKTPVLFTAYQVFDESVLHYNALLEREDRNANLVDLSKDSGITELIEICSGNQDEAPFFSQVKDAARVDEYIRTVYRDLLYIWLYKEKTRWHVMEVHVPEFCFETIMGEPMVRIKYGDRFSIVSLEELERI